MAAATAKGFRGKVVDLAQYSERHRTTLGHFLAEGKWDEAVLQTKVKKESLRQMVQLSNQTEEPLIVIHDDTIDKKTKPSSQAKSPMEQTDFHPRIWREKSFGAIKIKRRSSNAATPP